MASTYQTEAAPSEAASKSELATQCLRSMPTLTKRVQASWSSTLCLPRSTLPARATVADRAKYLKRCSDDLYAWQRAAPNPSSTQSFILHDGPPYANGSLHVGHALNKILKDIICRSQLSQGRRVEYIPGWDCHGLPIELKALQQRRDAGELEGNASLGAVAIRRAARELAARAVEEQKAGFREWAVMSDWDNAWRTMDTDFELRQLDVFKTMLEQGLIYRRFKPVYWSPSSGTALAEAELEYNAKHVSTAAFIKFPLITLPGDLASKLEIDLSEVSAVVWTTTPWTLPANRAIAIHSQLEYSIVESKTHGLLLVGTSRVKEIEKACKEEFRSRSHQQILGSDLIGASYCDPSHDKSTPRPILHADFVSADSGSGLVHVAPGHGMDDYKLGQQHNIETFAPVDDMGCFTPEASPNSQSTLTGKAVLKEGAEAVLEVFNQADAVLATHKHVHKYPYDWRSKLPVIVRATEQWFADVGEIRNAALASLDNVRFVPEAGKERLSSFIRSRSEWCISRQRAWGVPIPALYHKESGEALLTPESVSHVTSIIEERGIDAWWTDAEYDPIWTPEKLRSRGLYKRGKDTMDVWFDSGTSWTQIGRNQRHELSSMADVYIEGTDQHRGWFQSSLLTKIAYQAALRSDEPPVAPYKTLITHGFTLDQHGKKMSKSVGNVISPEQIMNGTLLPPIKRKNSKKSTSDDSSPTYDAMGPDLLRLWVSSCDYTKDVVVSQAVLKEVTTNLSKLRVTFKLLLGLLDSLDPKQPSVPFEQLDTLDQIALMQLEKMKETAQACCDSFEYHKAISAINQYLISDLSAFYIETIKDRMYADATESKSRVQVQLVIWEIFKTLTSLLAPITPLLVEEACDYLPKQLSFHPVKAAWGDASTHQIGGIEGDRQYHDVQELLPYLTVINPAVKSLQETARADKKMGSSLQSFVKIHAAAESKAASCLQRHREALADALVVSDVTLSTEAEAHAPSSSSWSCTEICNVQGEAITILVYEPSNNKCIRCWKYNVPVDNELEDAFCHRCVGVLEGLREEQPDIFEGKPRLDNAAKMCRVEAEGSAFSKHWYL